MAAAIPPKVSKWVDVLVSIAAAVVIWGALRKILHSEDADLWLKIGLTTEAGVFLIYGVLYIIYPAIDDHEVHIPGQAKLKPEKHSDSFNKLFADADITPEKLTQLSSSFQKLNSTVSNISEVGDVIKSTQHFSAKANDAAVALGSVTGAVNMATSSLATFNAAYAAGITNLSIDLIYGTPGLSEDEWKQNVEQAISFGIPHLSCYALTIEPRTALAGMIRLKKKEQTNADIQARHFELLMDWLQAAGYNHYEISNFALPGHHSRHNSSYWKGEHYLGLGPSAHSFNGSSRQWNISNNALYITGIENNLPNLEKEDLSLLQQLNEYIMISLRTMDGMLLDKITQRWGKQLEIKVLEAAAPWIQSGHLILNGQNLILSKPGKLFADRIASDLFQL